MSGRLDDPAIARAILALGFEPVVLFDDERRIVDANEAASELLGRRRDELLEMQVEELLPPHERARSATGWARFRREGSFSGGVRVARPDRSARNVELTARADIVPGLHVAVLRDVTSRVAAERELRLLNEGLADALDLQRNRADRSEAHLLLALGQIPTVVWVVDRDLRYTYVSQYRHGLTAEALLGRTDEEIWPAPTATEFVRLKREALRTNGRVDAEVAADYPDGRRVMQISAAPLHGADGGPVGVIGATTDVTVFREAEAAALLSRTELEEKVAERTTELAASRRLIDHVLDQLGVGAWVEDVRTGVVTYVSPGLERIVGYPASDFFDPTSWRMRVHPDDRSVASAAFERLESPELEYRVVDGDGGLRWLRERTTLIRAADGTPLLQYGICQDVTAIRAAVAAQEGALRESERRLRELIEGVDAAIALAEGPGDLRISEQVREMLGRQPAEVADFARWEALVHPEDFAACRAVWDGPEPTWTLEYRMRHADGRWIWVRDRGRRTRLPDGQLGRLFSVITDVTATREIEAAREAAVLAREALYRGLIEMQDAFFWEEDLPSHTLRYISPQVERLTGYPPDRFEGDASSWRAVLHPADRDEVIAAYQAFHEGTLEYRIRRRDGRTAWIREHSTLVRDPSGKAVRMIGLGTDITALRAAEEERLAIAARTSELARLEALARMAATTAHDFANILLGIDVFAGVLSADPTLGDRGRADVARIRSAVEHGRSVAAGLISLGRLGEATLVPTDVDTSIAGLRDSLTALLGSDIGLELTLGAGDTVAELDPAGLERALINLAVNARDALPAGGHVRIATREVVEDDSLATAVGIAHAGTYLSIEVADDGMGMDEETLRRAFEPYFTTKPVGRGTGLGLSSVHALVRAADGHAHAASAPGKGATVRICVPVVMATPGVGATIPTSPTSPSGSSPRTGLSESPRVVAPA